METTEEKQARRFKEMQEKKAQKARDENPVLRFGLDSIDLDIIKYLTDHPNATCPEISEAIGMSERQIWNRRKRQRFIDAMAELNKPTLEVIEKAQKISARRMVALANSSDAQVALEAGKLLLKPLLAEKIDMNVNHRITYKTRIGSEGRIYQEVETEKIDSPAAKKVEEPEPPQEEDGI